MAYILITSKENFAVENSLVPLMMFLLLSMRVFNSWLNEKLKLFFQYKMNLWDIELVAKIYNRLLKLISKLDPQHSAVFLKPVFSWKMYFSNVHNRNWESRKSFFLKHINDFLRTAAYQIRRFYLFLRCERVSTFQKAKIFKLMLYYFYKSLLKITFESCLGWSFFCKISDLRNVSEYLRKFNWHLRIKLNRKLYASLNNSPNKCKLINRKYSSIVWKSINTHLPFFQKCKWKVIKKVKSVCTINHFRIP